MVTAELSPRAGARLAPVEYAVAVDWYLEQASLSPGSRRVYRISLTGWTWPLVGRLAPSSSRRRGARPPVLPLALLDAEDTPDRLAAAVARRAEHADARTVNREVSALRGAVGWWRELGWIDRDPTAGLRHLVGGPATRPALSDPQAAAVFALPASLRDQALWRLLRDSGCAAEQVLALDAGGVDLARRAGAGRADVADVADQRYGAQVTWGAQTAELLSWLLAGRSCGPVFLTDRQARSRVLARDVCPLTGRARLSYRRAAEIFTSRTRPLDPAGRGWTLQQLRRPA